MREREGQGVLHSPGLFFAQSEALTSFLVAERVLMSRLGTVGASAATRSALMRQDGCGGRAGKAELLTGIEAASSRPVRKIVLLG